jgi:hypothetical protein
MLGLPTARRRLAETGVSAATRIGAAPQYAASRWVTIVGTKRTTDAGRPPAAHNAATITRIAKP